MQSMLFLVVDLVVLDLDLLDDVYDDEVISLPGASGNLSRSNTIESGGVHFRNLNRKKRRVLTV